MNNFKDSFNDAADVTQHFNTGYSVLYRRGIIRLKLLVVVYSTLGRIGEVYTSP